MQSSQTAVRRKDYPLRQNSPGSLSIRTTEHRWPADVAGARTDLIRNSGAIIGLVTSSNFRRAVSLVASLSLRHPLGDFADNSRFREVTGMRKSAIFQQHSGPVGPVLERIRRRPGLGRVRIEDGTVVWPKGTPLA
jgi:hypothetical protein